MASRKSRRNNKHTGLPKPLEILESISDGLFVLNRDWRFTYVNKRAAGITDLQPEDLLGQNIWEKYPQFIGTDLEMKYRRCIAEGTPQELRMLDLSGKIWFHIRVYPSREGVSVYWHDITEHQKAEMALKESERRYEALISASSELLYRMSPDWTEMYQLHSHGFLSNTERSNPNWLEEYIPPEAQALVLSTIKTAILRKSVFELEHQVWRADGKLGWTHSRAVPILDASGEIVEWFGAATDITESKQVEEALQQSNLNFMSLFNNKIVGLAYCRTVFDDHYRAVDYEILDINPTYERLTGLKREQIVGKRITEAVPGFDRDMIDRHNRVALTGEETRFETYEFITARWYEVNVFSPRKGYFITLFSNITKRKNAEQALARARDELEARVKERTMELAESEKKYRLLVENANEAVVVVQGGSFRFLNNKSLEISGYSRQELLSRSFIDIIHPDDREAALTNQRRRMRGEDAPASYEIRLISGDGAVKWVRVNAAMLEWQGKPATLGLITDITQKKTMEQELKAYAQRITRVQEEERKRIAYDLHDDTAQYLAVLKLELDSLLQSGKIKDSQIIEKLKFLERDAGRAVDDLRRYSHELRPGVLEHLGLQAALEQIAEDQNRLGQILVEVDVEGSEPEIPEDVKLGFFRIAQEAVNNIRKHAKVSMACINLKYSQNHLHMIVKDDGIGFDLQTPSARVGEKRNLGMISMQERAKLIGADLTIESAPGKGTIIRLNRLL